MAPHKDGKKKDASTSDFNPSTNILSDTTSWITYAIKSWKQVYDILEHVILIYPDDFSEEEDESFSVNIRFLAHSELHRIVSRTKIVPCNDMIFWSLEHIDIKTISIINYQKTFVDSFRPRDLKVTYKISSTPKNTYTETFLLDFERKEWT